MDTPELKQQRDTYKQIRDQLNRRSIGLDQIPYDELGDYPLVPYLKYQDINSRLDKLPHQDVEAFLEDYQNTWLADRLLKNWLEALASKGRWQEFESYYQPEAVDTDLKCLYLTAKKRNGDPTALASVANIWNQGSSQPKRCDSLFAMWLRSDYFTTDIAWSRYVKAIDARKLALAKYVRGLLDADQLPMADAMLDLYSHPERLDKLHNQLKNNAEMDDVIHYGVRRFARKDSIGALYEWEKFDSAYLLDNDQRNETIEYLAYRLILDGYADPANRLLDRNQLVSDRVLQRQLRDSLKDQDWADVSRLIARLPEEEKETARWQYWALRAAEKQSLMSQEEISAGYRTLASQRDFYGFLSAERTQLPYSLTHVAVTSTEAEVAAISEIAAIKRSHELYKLGYLNQARMEWRYGIRDFDHTQLLAAGKLANAWGWHRKTIESLGQAKYWDDLDLRFPLIYDKEVASASQASQVAPEYLLAIARQESAFAADARSPAGAMGLMQLMPATASQTARSIGLTYHQNDLYKPQQNLLLGGTYLSQMLERFNGNRILATAAYNAGPHRVDKWLNPAGKGVDYDIWIETIPFDETRGYVQNVLSYSVIYSHRMGVESRLLQTSEMSQPL